MKKTYVIQFDYDEDKPDLLETFGVSRKSLESIDKRYKNIVTGGIASKSAALIKILDTTFDEKGEACHVSGGEIMVLLAQQLDARLIRNLFLRR
jgi:hypothetical protein